MIFTHERSVVGRLGLLLLSILLVTSSPARAVENGDGNQIPVENTVTMVDLGANNCLPCRMMTPIIAELKKTYQGKAAIIFIDVYRDSTSAKKFHAMIIPTQIFFDRKGNEVSRHQGFMEKEEIIKELNSLLAQKG